MNVTDLIDILLSLDPDANVYVPSAGASVDNFDQANVCIKDADGDIIIG